MHEHSFNPGRIDPTNAAWDDSRKPLAAAWQTIGGSNPGTRFFTVNLQLTAKLDSSTVFGNPRPPVNAGVAQRTDQITVLAVRGFLRLFSALHRSGTDDFSRTS
jgi:hypothetical protein